MRRNTGRKQANFSRIPLETPDTFPSLKRPIAMLNQDPISKAQTKELGKYSLSLLSSLSLSIYKKLFAKNLNKDVLFNYQDIKNIRNLYLKRLVESNQENFPFELSQDEYKVVELTKDEKIKVMIERLKEISKNDKGKGHSLEVSRKSSVNRKESLDETKKINDRSNKEKMLAQKKNESKTSNNNSVNTTQNNINNDNSEEDENEHNNSVSYEDEENYINDPEDDDGDNEGDYSANLDEGGEY